MKKLLMIYMVFVLLSLCAGSSRAGWIFFDNFDNYPHESDWLPPAISGWSVLDGTVDIHGAPGPWDVWPGNGRYVDMDGSSNDAGVLCRFIYLQAGSYVLSYELAGTGENPDTGAQRGGDNTVEALVAGVSKSITLPYTTPFTTYTLPFTVNTSGLVSIAFYDPIGLSGTVLGDNAGLFLDDVGVYVIPAPGAILLGAVGIGFVGFLRRRRKLC